MEAKETRRIGIMGGTFDPIHYGHLVLAEGVRDSLDLEKILFIPTGDPPHKRDRQVTPARTRLAMVKLAIADNPWFETSDMEVRRPGTSYTVDTLERLRDAYGDACEWYFITGADAIVDILSWKDVERIADLCAFVAAARPGTNKERLRNFLDDLPGYLQNKVHVIQVPALQISSTDIRRKVSAQRTVRYLLPAAVETYIHRHGLYRKEDRHA